MIFESNFKKKFIMIVRSIFGLTFLALFCSCASSYQAESLTSDGISKSNSYKGIKAKALKKNIRNQKSTKITNASFFDGEKINFNIRYLGFVVAEVFLKTNKIKKEGGGKAYHSKWSVSPSGVFSLFVDVTGEAHVYADYKTLFPYKLEQNFISSGRVSDAKLLLDRASLKAHYIRSSKGGNKKDKLIKKSWKIYKNSQNFFSFIFYLRKKSIKPGDVVKFYMVSSGKNYLYKVKALRYELIRVGSNKVRTILLKPEVSYKGKAVAKKKNLFLWLTDDEHRYPVKFQGKTKVGFLTAEISRIEN